MPDTNDPYWRYWHFAHRLEDPTESDPRNYRHNPLRLEDVPELRRRAEAANVKIRVWLVDLKTGTETLLIETK